MLICQENYGKNRDFFLLCKRSLFAPQADPFSATDKTSLPQTVLCAIGRVQAEPRWFERMQTKLASKDRIL